MLTVVLAIVCLSATALAASGAGIAAFPVQNSANERYLVDQNRVPFPIMGRTAWFVTSLSVSDYHTFIDDTAARGYNAIVFHVVNHDPRGNNPPFNGNGDRPFLNRLDGATWSGSLTYENISTQAPDFTIPNEAYWSFVDDLLAYCETKGILVFLFPAYVGFQGGNQGWMQEMVANGPARMGAYGAWIATRYRNQKNLVWMMGGDLGTFNTEQNNVEGALLTGLKSVPEQQSIHFSAEWSSGMIATDQESFGAAMTLNGTYSWTGDVNSLGRSAYAHTPVRPAFLLEEPFDQEGPDGNGVNQNATQPVRRFQWWGWLSSIGGYVSGNGYVWPFPPVWQEHLDTQGSQDMARLNAFISSIKWYKLVPSGLGGMRNLITAGGSTVNSSDYVAAAASLDGTLLVGYIPPAHSGTITVDMAAMSGVAQARWFDPTSGVYSQIGSGLPNTGKRVFSPPGNNSAGESDWILIIETKQPPDTELPTVTLTAPKAGAIVSNSVLVSATATDNVGVVGVRFQVDGVNVGAEVLSPPYTATWNTWHVGNGTHTVRAIARDLASNSALSSVSVTVSNDATSPLVGAYGFSEGAGTTVADASGLGNTGAINGAAWTSQGRFGNALSFDGTNWVTVEDADSLDLSNRMTLEAWVYPTMAPGIWTNIVLKEAPPNNLAYMIQADPSNRPSTYISTDAAGLRGVVGPQPLPLNTWSHLAATYDGIALRLYVNGTAVASAFVFGNILTSGGPLRFGGTSIWVEYFVGTIDEIRIYRRALSQTEIQADMDAAIVPPTPTPTPPTTLGISGSIFYCPNPNLLPVPNVMLTLTGGVTTSVMTDGSGNYQFSSLASGGTYAVMPSKTALTPGTTGARINTVDMIATQRHFLQIAVLSGCRLAAADVNGDNTPNTIDMIAIQRFYLGQTSGIGNVGKYRFTPVNRAYPGIVSNQTGQNYDALVFGDVAVPFVERPGSPSQSAAGDGFGAR